MFLFHIAFQRLNQRLREVQRLTWGPQWNASLDALLPALGQALAPQSLPGSLPDPLLSLRPALTSSLLSTWPSQTHVPLTVLETSDHCLLSIHPPWIELHISTYYYIPAWNPGSEHRAREVVLHACILSQ